MTVSLRSRTALMCAAGTEGDRLPGLLKAALCRAWAGCAWRSCSGATASTPGCAQATCSPRGRARTRSPQPTTSP
ncbi:hypothetical protein HaLaN_15556 [Haematococcus lacustris]|uniref:Uncharacterized protein n=1 Tax=Haematococcus lacustris TaxID=44745 RepID=A0A699ZJH7_HAELA|nr:hypothetical protein HaLaN_15556 [Haematococcus lacustris]